MKIKTADLTGAALDWAVAKLLNKERYGIGLIYLIRDGKWLDHDKHRYSTDWAQAGPIIDRETISVISDDYHGGRGGRSRWSAALSVYESDVGGSLCYGGDGPTPLIAAMRCFVASRLGDEVDVPEELCS